jgi:hypothetical protein
VAPLAVLALLAIGTLAVMSVRGRRHDEPSASSDDVRSDPGRVARNGFPVIPPPIALDDHRDASAPAVAVADPDPHVAHGAHHARATQPATALARAPTTPVSHAPAPVAPVAAAPAPAASASPTGRTYPWPPSTAAMTLQLDDADRFDREADQIEATDPRRAAELRAMAAQRRDIARGLPGNLEQTLNRLPPDDPDTVYLRRVVEYERQVLARRFAHRAGP